MEKPLVSILIPVYNREKLIAETIASALDQNYDNFEVVVVDNSSTDSTWELIQGIAATDSRIRAFRNDTNVGPVRNWIECVRHAQGVLSKILWSDDLISPDYLSRTVPMLSDPRVGFVYTSARIFKESTDSSLNSICYDHLGTGVYDTRIFIEGSLLDISFPVSPGCFLLRTQDLINNLLADIPNAIGSDFKSHAIGNDLLLLLLTANSYDKFGVINEPLSMFREHAGSISTSSGMERLVVHYNIAKAYFVHQCCVDKDLRHRFNTLLWLHHQRFDFGPFGVRSLQDFYPLPCDTQISVKYLIKRTINRMVRISRRDQVHQAHMGDFSHSTGEHKYEGGKRCKMYSTIWRPRLTIITVVYNGAESIVSTIDSVLALNNDDVEYLVIDGGSTDGTVDLLKNYESNIDYWLSEKDSGIYDAMNKGVKLATGEYVYFLNAGDTFISDNVLDQVFDLLESEPTLLMNRVRAISHFGSQLFPKVTGLIDVRETFLSAYCHQAAFARRDAYLAVGGFDLSYRHFADFKALWSIRNLSGAKLVETKHEIANFPLDGVSSDWRSTVKLIKERERLLSELGKSSNILKYCVHIVRAHVYTFRMMLRDLLRQCI